jgi:gamma-glutamyltranspeptidase / glutathione hydrolase
MNVAAALALPFAWVLTSGALLPPNRVLPPNDMVARGEAGAVVSAEPRATRIGLEVLQKGGNAVDAAVAVALALAVTHPQAGNLGGGGFLLIRMADGREAAIDFRERAPKGASQDMYLRADGSVDTDKVQYGASAAGVPGSPAGLVHALHAFGSQSLQQLAAPAIRLAREGFAVDQFLAGDLAAAAKELGRYESTRKIFFKDGRPLLRGELLVQSDLAGTLERFAKDGHDGFYRGITAERIVAQMQQDGGFVTALDLTDYTAKPRQVLKASYRGVEVWSMPPPSSGGVALLQMLNMLEGFELSAGSHGSSRTLHLLTEVMRRAYADRAKWLGDPDHHAVPTDGLIGKEYAKALRAGIDLDKKVAVAAGVPPGAKESDDTTHFSIVDAAGNAVACTTTINSTFGAMCVVEGAGFLLNNEMDDFSAKPGVPNQFGLVGGKANAIAPGKRMLSSMTPTIVLQNGKLRLVLGAPGGGRIITAVLQVLLNVVDHQMGLYLAVRAPRIHHQWLPDEIQWEPLALPEDVRTGLERRGHTIAKSPRGIGQVFAIEIVGERTRVAVCDHRSGGSAAAY